MRKVDYIVGFVDDENNLVVIHEFAGVMDIGDDNDLCRSEGVRVADHLHRLADEMKRATLNTYGEGDD